MRPLLFALPGAEPLGAALARQLHCEHAQLTVHRFPDGELNPCFGTLPKGRPVILVSQLDRPDQKIMALYLAACVARELGAAQVGVVLPYLPYMRQDAQFRSGEGITARHFARLVSSCCDWLVTVDPHLHRFHDLGQIYSVPSTVVPAAPAIASWINAHVAKPIVVGPDGESAQWAEQIAAAAGCPYLVLSKQRSGDHAVAVSVPDTRAWAGRTPVLVDDIVSTAGTMIAAAAHILAAGQAAPVCIGVHALFAGDAYEALQRAGAARIVSCNSVAHASNAIDLSAALAEAIDARLAGAPAAVSP